MLVFRFVNATLGKLVQGKFLYMPTQKQHQENISTMYELHKLRNVIGGVDGCHIPFLEKPSQIPVGKTERGLLEVLINKFMIFSCQPLVPSMMELSVGCPMQGHGLKPDSLRGSYWGIVHILRRILR